MRTRSKNSKLRLYHKRVKASTCRKIKCSTCCKRTVGRKYASGKNRSFCRTSKNRRA